MSTAGLPISVETAPHLILFADEDVADRNTLMKCMPPLRDAANREGLRRGLQAGLGRASHALTVYQASAWHSRLCPLTTSICLQDGIIDTLASDHSPVPGEAKLLQEGDFIRAWGGVAGALPEGPCLMALAGLAPAAPPPEGCIGWSRDTWWQPCAACALDWLVLISRSQ